jgi:hypothetical protein
MIMEERTIYITIICILITLILIYFAFKLETWLNMVVDYYMLSYAYGHGHLVMDVVQKNTGFIKIMEYVHMAFTVMQINLMDYLHIII